MNFWDVFGEMLVILFAIAAGYAANRLGYLGGEADQKVSSLLLNITMPAMIVAAVITGEELPELSIPLHFGGWAWCSTCWRRSLCWWCPSCCRERQGQKGVWRYALAFPNWGSSAIPWRWPCLGTALSLCRHPGPALQPAGLQSGPAAAGGPPKSGGSCSPPASWPLYWGWCWH